MRKRIPGLSEYFAAMGKKGSRARAKKLTAEERKQIASNAAKARWAKRESSTPSAPVR
jgi:hypothetical protein